MSTKLVGTSQNAAPVCQPLEKKNDSISVNPLPALTLQIGMLLESNSSTKPF